MLWIEDPGRIFHSFSDRRVWGIVYELEIIQKNENKWNVRVRLPLNEA